jgi:hypothetical protein
MRFTHENEKEAAAKSCRLFLSGNVSKRRLAGILDAAIE